MPAQAVAAALRQGDVLISPEQQAELTEVLTRRKFDRYAPQDKRLRFLTGLLSRATQIDVTNTVRLCRDPKDDKFLNLALDGPADFIVSGDADLLTLHPFHGTSTLSPRMFLDAITTE